MWRVDDFFIYGCVFCYWMFRSDVSVIPFRMCLCFNHSFWPLSLRIFDLSLLLRDKFSSQMISRTDIWLLGLDRIFK